MCMNKNKLKRVKHAHTFRNRTNELKTHTKNRDKYILRVNEYDLTENFKIKVKLFFVIISCELYQLDCGMWLYDISLFELAL